MKKLILSGSALLLACSIYAQHSGHSGCGSNYTEAMKNPEFAAEQAKFNQYLQQYAQADEKANGYRIMPVVVHIIHNGGSSNVSDATVHTMITRMNQAYSKTAPNINTLPLRFDSIAGEAKIEFRLATKDPLGNCTDGIRRVYAPQKSINSYDDKDFKKLSYWDRTKYLNIWIVNNIVQPGESGSGSILGYAYYPAEAPALRDGATIDHGAMTTQAVVSHEVGHHLNLVHIWGDSFCGDDLVDDTPIAQGENFAWANPCGTDIKEATCYQDVVDNTRDSILRYMVGENYQNYMDYVNNYNCPNMFTEGQIARMNAALEFYTYRGSMVTEANNIATGTQDNAPACPGKAPIAEFWATKNLTCAGSSISFQDGSFNGAPTAWAWEFEGGTPAISSDQNPTVTYATPGTYGVTLTVTNANGTGTKTKQNVVFIMDPTVESKAWGYAESFESGGNYQQGRWTVVKDQTDPGKEWALSAPDISFTGHHSIKMNNFQNVRDNNSSLISPAVDMNAISGGNKVIRFKVAYALRTNETLAYDPVAQIFLGIMNDRLSLSRSEDCGETWTTVRNFTVADILSAGLSPNNFNPTSLALWKQVSVNLNGPNAVGSNVRFRFHFNSGGPHNNNLFIDDIQIIATSGTNASIDELSAENLGLNVYPNPVTENSVLTFNLPESVDKARIGVYDIAGRHVADVYSGQLPVGEQTFTISRELLSAAGVYFVRLDLDGKALTRKIVAQ